MNNKIAEDLKNAMKSGDKFKLSVLRMLKSALLLESKAVKKDYELSDEEVIKVIKKQVKTRKDSITEYQKYEKIDYNDFISQTNYKFDRNNHVRIGSDDEKNIKFIVITAWIE